MTLKEMLYHADGSKKTVRFIHYFDGSLWYETEDLFVFPVPIADIGNATFHAQDHAPLFMRYVRKHLETIEASKQNAD